MHESNFDKLLDRYLTGKVSPEEKKAIEAWLEVQKTNAPLDHEYSKEEEERIFQEILKRKDSGTPFKTFSPKRPFLNSWAIIGIAASMLLLLSVSLYMWKSEEMADGVEKMILNDGTIVWLKHGGRLTYSESNDGRYRNAELHGEGLFEVAKDSLRPFTIRSGSLRVQVLGTSFNLKMIDDSVRLDVLTGKVKVTSISDSIGVTLVANEKLYTSNVLASTHEKLTGEELKEIVKRTEYDMEFTSEDLKSILHRIEQKFNVRVELPSEFAGDCKLTADFTDHSLGRTFEMLSEVIDINYSLVNNKVIVNHINCN